ncbi:hypothetical protein GCM10009768_26320 [Leucobacter iarius]|uniref:Integral membrane protein n=1 Tax=Leucobacter iarius TaxID=333963 RepID=A0ABP4XVE1_9MICO
MGPHRRFPWKVVALAFVWPLAWLTCTFLHGAVTNWYPHFILNAGHLGLNAAALDALAVIAYALVITVIVVAIDLWLPSLTAPDDTHRPLMNTRPELNSSRTPGAGQISRTSGSRAR